MTYRCPECKRILRNRGAYRLHALAGHPTAQAVEQRKAVHSAAFLAGRERGSRGHASVKDILEHAESCENCKANLHGIVKAVEASLAKRSRESQTTATKPDTPVTGPATGALRNLAEPETKPEGARSEQPTRRVYARETDIPYSSFTLRAYGVRVRDVEGGTALGVQGDEEARAAQEVLKCRMVKHDDGWHYVCE